MKILYKPKLLPVECFRCGCIFRPKRGNLTVRDKKDKIKDRVICPHCHTNNPANFEHNKRMVNEFVKPHEEGVENEQKSED